MPDVLANWFIALRVLGGDFMSGVSAPAQVRLFAPEDLHITLAFLGKVGEERALQSFAHAPGIPLAALSTSLGEVVALGPRRRPSAFSALPIDQRAQIEAGMSAIRDVLCDAAGAARETRPALAHVTLARPSRRATSAEIAAAKSWASSLTRAAPRVRIESIALYTWSQDRARSLFRIVAQAPLSLLTL